MSPTSLTQCCHKNGISLYGQAHSDQRRLHRPRFWEEAARFLSIPVSLPRGKVTGREATSAPVTEVSVFMTSRPRRRLDLRVVRTHGLTFRITKPSLQSATSLSHSHISVTLVPVHALESTALMVEYSELRTTSPDVIKL